MASTATRTSPTGPATTPDAARLDVPIEGMSCGSCAARIERALTAEPGITAAGVNFATKRATVAFDPRRTHPDAIAGATPASGLFSSHDTLPPIVLGDDDLTRDR